MLRLPGQNLYDGGRLSRLLAQMPDSNNGSHAGGLGSVLQKVFQGYMMSKEDGDMTAANQAMVEGMKGRPEVQDAPGPTIGGDAGYTIPGKAGGIEGAVKALSGLGDNAYAGRLSQDLMTQKMTQDAENQQWNDRFKAQNDAQDVRFGKQLEEQRADRKDQRGYQDLVRQDEQAFRKEMLRMQAGIAASQRQPQTVRTAEGLFVLNPNGTLGNRLGGLESQANPFPFATGAGGQSPNAGPVLTGEDFLKSLPSGLGERVKGITEGRIPYPTGMYLKTPQGQAELAAISQYAPGFDATVYNARASTNKDFTSGQAARNVTSLNTALGHLDALNNAAGDLQNSNFTPLNVATNFVREHTGDPRTTNYHMALNAVADELEKAFRGTGGSVEGIRQWRESMSQNLSPEQQKAAVQQGLELLNSRIGALTDQYNRGMGTQRQGFELLNPKEQEIYKRLSRKDGGGNHASSASAGWSVQEVR